MTDRYDVYAIGNAIVDTDIRVSDAWLAENGMEKGFMTLVDPDQQEALLGSLQDHARHGSAGGSAANTIVGVAQFGGGAAFTGMVGADMAGALYREGMAEVGVRFDVEAREDAATGRCLVLVTPDGERTMQTSLGAAIHLTKEDIEREWIKQSKVVYVEGYLVAGPGTAEAAEFAMKEAKKAGAQVALTLSDPPMAQNFRDEFRRWTKAYVDILFCNEQEGALYAGVDGSREDVLRAIGEDCPFVFMTCGPDGSMVYDHGKMLHVPGYNVPVVDTTGAGDLYAAGVLYGLTQGMDVEKAGKLGSFASARIVAEVGPRLRVRLGDHVSHILDGGHPMDLKEPEGAAD